MIGPRSAAAGAKIERGGTSRATDMRARDKFDKLLRRLARAGFRKDFVASGLLPEWWEPGCANDPALLPDLEFRIARFLGVAPSVLSDASTSIRPPAYPGAQLRRVRNVDRDRLSPAIHAATQIAAATVRSLRPSVPAPDLPPSDGVQWRRLLTSQHPSLRLPNLLADVWRRGIPVIPVDVLPAPSFQAFVCVVDGRPALVVSYKYEAPGRVAFLLAHEVGHVVYGDCALRRRSLKRIARSRTTRTSRGEPIGSPSECSPAPIQRQCSRLWLLTTSPGRPRGWRSRRESMLE